MNSLNQYFVCLGDNVIEWDIHDENQGLNVHTEYFSETMQAWENASGSGGWTVYLTWNIDSLPSYGERVIAIVLGDEMAQKPRYTDYVCAIFKCYGAGPRLGFNPLHSFNYQQFLSFFQFLYTRSHYVKSVAKAKFASFPVKKVLPGSQKIYPIPLGYANQVELPVKPLEKRTVDISFAGSVVHKKYAWYSFKKWFRTPKSQARSKMVSALRRIDDAHTQINIGLNITGSFSEIRTADPVEYSDLLMNSRVSLVPRGASFETYRFFESLRAGCIVIAEYLPPFWFYDDAPVITISDWNNLEKVVIPLFQNHSIQVEMHQKVLAWWKNTCSADATGSYIASILKQLNEEKAGLAKIVSRRISNGHVPIVNQAHKLVQTDS